MTNICTHRVKNEWSLLAYSFKLLIGPGLVALLMIMGVLLLMILTRELDAFNTRFACLLFHMETFAPLLGIVIFNGLLGADFDTHCMENLHTSDEGITRVLFRKMLHSALFCAAACLIILSLLRIFYTPFNVIRTFGIIIPAVLYFGMLGLVATAATRKTLGGLTVGTALLMLSISGKHVDPLRLRSYTSQRDLTNMRLLEDDNWLIAKVYFFVISIVLAFFIVRIIQSRKERIRGLLAVVTLLAVTSAGLHWLWDRPVPLPQGAEAEIIDTRDIDNNRRVRIAISTLEQEDTYRTENTLIREKRFTRIDGQWVFDSESFFHASSEADLVHLDLDCSVDPGSATLTVSANMQLMLIDGPTEHVFFYLANQLELTELFLQGEPVEYKRRRNLVDIVLPRSLKRGDLIEVNLTYSGSLSGIAEGIDPDFIALFDNWYPTTRDHMQNWVDPFTLRMNVCLPKPWTLAGSEILKEETGEAVYTWSSQIPIHRPPLCAGIFKEYKSLYRDIPLTVHAFTFEEAYAKQLLDACADILAVYESAFGSYPHNRLAFIENRFQNSSGVAQPGMMTLRPEYTLDEQDGSMFDVLLPHEIGHQWWRLGLPKWFAEGCAVYSNYRYLAQRKGQATAIQFMDETIYTPYMDSASAIEPLVTNYSNKLAMYARGAYLFTTLESLLGKEVLSQALQEFIEHHLHASQVNEEDVNRDIEKALQTIAGPGLHAFVTDWMRGAKRFDPSVVKLWQTESEEGYNIAIQLEHKGAIQLPTPARLEFVDGSSQDLVWPAEELQTILRIQSRKPVARVQLDPERHLLDWNRDNNLATVSTPPVDTNYDSAPSITRWTSFTTQDGLSAPRSYALLFGNDMKLYASFGHPGWLGGNEWLINTYDGQWNALVPGLEQPTTILAMAQAKDGTLWFGGIGALCRVSKEKAVMHILKEERRGRVGAAKFIPRSYATSSIPGSDVFALHIDRKDNLWVGTDHGASVLNTQDGTWRYFSANEGLDGQAVMVFAEDADGVIWAGTSSGVFSFSDNQWSPHPEIAKNDLILSIAIEPTGRMWFGTYRSGLVSVKNKVVRHFTSANSDLVHDMVSTLAIDPQGRIWIGGGIGLSYLDGNTWQHFDQDNSGLPCSKINRLVYDGANHLWIGTEVGITRYEL